MRLCENHPLSDLLLISELGVLCPVEYSHNLGVSVILVTLFHGASPVEYRLDQDRVVRPKHYSTEESYLFSDLRSLSRQACPEQSRRDAKTAKRNTFLFLRTWRPLRLCESYLLSDFLLIAPRRQDRKENFFDPLPWRPLPRGVRPWGSYSACVEINTPQGELSFLRFPKPKFNGKFQISLVRCLCRMGSIALNLDLYI